MGTPEPTPLLGFTQLGYKEKARECDMKWSIWEKGRMGCAVVWQSRHMVVLDQWRRMSAQ
ncbi:4-hydroxyphenylpyruvate dioxygenase [Sesbania bispinosa]|nr:4-hydroxyphenylpyruvate dioxygenase [Sesbania bispinosa]